MASLPRWVWAAVMQLLGREGRGEERSCVPVTCTQIRAWERQLVPLLAVIYCYFTVIFF